MTTKEQILKTGGAGWVNRIAAANLASKRRERPTDGGVEHVTMPPAPVIRLAPPFRMWELGKRRKAVAE